MQTRTIASKIYACVAGRPQGITDADLRWCVHLALREEGRAGLWCEGSAIRRDVAAMLRTGDLRQTEGGRIILGRS